MSARTRFAGNVVALLVVAGASQAANAEPLRIAYPIWVGNGPLFVAQEKGLFSAEGIDVHLINIEDTQHEALADGQIDAGAATINTTVLYAAKLEDRFVCVLAMDESLGGDGIVAHKDIRSIADLRGKTVASNHDTVGQFYLNVLLMAEGLTEADIASVDLDSQNAAEAFMLQEVDAAVTFEPWLTQSKNTEHGRLLTDSSQHPGLIVDCLYTTPALFSERKAEFQALARAWAAAVDYIAAHPEKAIEIMARNVGGWLEDPTVFAETLKGIRFYDEQRNREYFGTPQMPGQVYDTVQKAMDVWSSLGVLIAQVSPADFIAYGVWDE
jgi:NitT/TauT family transport system substrate-binding protein